MKETKEQSIEERAKEYSEKIIPLVSIKNDRIITTREAVREDINEAFKAGYSSKV